MLIPLTQGYSTEVDKNIYDLFSVYKWRYDKGYAVRSSPRVKGKQKIISLHRLIMNASHGIQVDHINGNTLDNRILNLRLCSQKNNIQNQKIRKNNTSGYKGVYSKTKNKWGACIGVNNKLIHLGSYDNKHDAALAYNEAAIKYHKNFAKLNEVIS